MTIQDEANQIARDLEHQRDNPVKIGFFGETGAGKSALGNALIGGEKEYFSEGTRTDTTIKAKAYQQNDIVYIDFPGFGTESFKDWKFFEGHIDVDISGDVPDDLRGKYKWGVKDIDLAVLCFNGKFNELEVSFIKRIQELNIPCIIVRTRLDEIKATRTHTAEQKIEEIRLDVNRLFGNVDLIFVSSVYHEEINIDKLQEGIEDKLEPARRERFIKGYTAKSASALNKKKAVAESTVTKRAALAAINGINPIPGADIAIDFGIMLEMFAEIRKDYGLDKDNMPSNIETLGPTAMQAASNIIKYATKEGLILLLKRFASRQVIKSVTKYVPFVGQAIAASVGFGMTKWAGDTYLDDCHEVASAIFDARLKRQNVG